MVPMVGGQEQVGDDFFQAVQKRNLRKAFRAILNVVRCQYDTERNTYKCPDDVDAEAYVRCFNLSQSMPPNTASRAFLSVKTSMEQALGEEIDRALAGPPEELELLCNMWTDHHSVMRWANFMFAHLTAVPVVLSQGVQPQDLNLADVWTAQGAYKDAFSKNQKKLCRVISDIIAAERRNEFADRTALLQTVCSTLLTSAGIACYRIYLEKPFLAQTAAHYATVLEAWKDMPTDQCWEYAQRVDDMVNLEQKRIETYLHLSTIPKMRAMLEDTLFAGLREHLAANIETGVPLLLAEEKFSLLSSVSRLLQDNKLAQATIFEAIRKHILGEGNALCRLFHQQPGVPQRDRSLQFVQSLLSLWEHYMHILTHHFASSKRMAQSLKEAFLAIISELHDLARRLDLPVVPMEEILAVFVDHLAKTQRTTNLLQGLAYLAKCIDGTSMSEYYARLMAKRLLKCGDELSIAAEQELLHHVLPAMNPSCTRRLKTMLDDARGWSVNQSKSTSDDPKVAALLGVLKPQVLNTVYWPEFRVASLRVPPTLACHLDAYGQWYRSEHPRTLR
eukprot:NODE_1295_length_1793_cov_92.000599_g1230_i0.p1 GENE.NODE_1295_length_1793_cov_92.000599_g1230_i0~~NODE_1295_length_1793_cov_92.000599_g1230_i0.p1  ORF type:complete len:561 (-),score=92.21 NODE_1295_length_1793_cov_92.000599_g1230_i0:5-1687(-)